PDLSGAALRSAGIANRMATLGSGRIDRGLPCADPAWPMADSQTGGGLRNAADLAQPDAHAVVDRDGRGAALGIGRPHPGSDLYRSRLHGHIAVLSSRRWAHWLQHPVVPHTRSACVWRTADSTPGRWLPAGVRRPHRRER